MYPPPAPRPQYSDIYHTQTLQHLQCFLDGDKTRNHEYLGRQQPCQSYAIFQDGINVRTDQTQSADIRFFRTVTQLGCINTAIFFTTAGVVPPEPQPQHGATGTQSRDAPS